MPGRVASGRPLRGTTTKPKKRKANKGTSLNALEIAERQNPVRTKIRPHRLGEVEEDLSRTPNHSEVVEQSAKRRKISHTGAESDQDIQGSDSDGNRWHEGVGEDDEDSDIDSDEAFGESDQERFADFTFRGGSTLQVQKSARPKPRRVQVIDLSEGEDASLPDSEQDEELGTDDGLGPDAVDLATAWDMDDEDTDHRQGAQSSRKIQRPAQEQERSNSSEGEADHSDEEQDVTDDDASELLISDDEQDAAAHSKFLNFVQNLQGSTDAVAPVARKDTKLSAATLLEASRDPGHRRALRISHNGARASGATSSSTVSGRLAPPLAKRQQDRLDRAAAYDKSKETLNRWIDTVKANRRAEHVVFPLTDPNIEASLSVKQLPPLSLSEPQTALESTIQNIMQESGLGSTKGHNGTEQELAFEELQTKTVPIEEVQARRSQLRMARELMFREEIRARRIKKIKSKAYRRVHRKEREKGAEAERSMLEKAGILDSDDERERHDRKRAEARMGARHRESKWAKAIKATGQAVWNEDARGGVDELARKDDELRRRIEGKNVSESDASNYESSTDDFAEEDDSDVDQDVRLQEKLAGLAAQQGDKFSSKSNLGSMAFMQRAEAAKKAANDAMVEEIRRDLDIGDGAVDDDQDVEMTGRTKYGMHENSMRPARPDISNRSDFEERLDDDEREAELDLSDGPQATNMAASQKSKETQNSRRDVTLQNQRAPTLSQTTKKPPASSKHAHKFNPVPRSHTTQYLDDATSSSGSEDEAAAEAEQAPVVLRQEDMVKMLFAGDDVIREDFEQDKKDTVQEEGDQVVDNSLPGWGSWTGDGISNRAQKRSKERSVTVVKGIAVDRRQDSKLDRVIINEKLVKKNGKYLASELPHPFESRQQYERSLRLPIGPEWTTKNTFQDATKPRVLIKQGVIRPMVKPIV